MLSPKDKKHLKALAHELKPVVAVGKRGFSTSLMTEVDAALIAHELIKVKFQESAADEIESITERICKELDAELVEFRGHMATLYKANPDKPKIRL
jgi:RNA-binding protein